MKKLLVAILILFIAGCAHSQVQPQSTTTTRLSMVDLPQAGDTVVETYHDYEAAYGYDETSITKDGNVVTFLGLVVFNGDDNKGIAASIGRLRVDCLEETVKIDTNVLFDRNSKQVGKGDIDDDFTPIEVGTPMIGVFEGVCRTRFRRSLAI